LLKDDEVLMRRRSFSRRHPSAALAAAVAAGATAPEPRAPVKKMSHTPAAAATTIAAPIAIRRFITAPRSRARRRGRRGIA
jgi:hypothetical protein